MNRRTYLLVLMMFGTVLMVGCSLTYYDSSRSGSKEVTEFGLLGLPRSANADTPGVIPVWRCTKDIEVPQNKETDVKP